MFFLFIHNINVLHHQGKYKTKQVFKPTETKKVFMQSTFWEELCKIHHPKHYG